MDIKILDSHLRKFLKTNATAQQIAKHLSLTSVSIERLEKTNDDFIYNVEVTTNRPDLASAVGLAREASAVLSQNGISAEFIPPLKPVEKDLKNYKPLGQAPLYIVLQTKAVYRVCAVVMEISIKKSPVFLTKTLEASGIRSLNNIIDITNYVMRTIGHPCHVFDYDRIKSQTIRIRESRKGEQIQTLDGKTYLLPGGDIIAEDKDQNIIDLLGIMGLSNSVVTDKTKRIIFFIDNNETKQIRQTSMRLGIRTEAAQLNEKGVDPDLALTALHYGIKLYQEIADGKIISEIIDLYPKKEEKKSVTVNLSQIQSLIGISISRPEAVGILEKLGFITRTKGDEIQAIIPTFRRGDINIAEDLIEEIARVYGYQNLPSLLPSFPQQQAVRIESDEFFWEMKIKHAFQFWGLTEVYTQSMVSEELFEGVLDEAVTIANPLSEDLTYMRTTLVPSLLQVLKENKSVEEIKIFEIANVYHKQKNKLPNELRKLAGVIKKPHLSFFEVKGIIEQLAKVLGITNLCFTTPQGNQEIEIYIKADHLGTIEILDENLINFEINFAKLLFFANLKKTYLPSLKYPPLIEDLALIVPFEVTTGAIIAAIYQQDKLIKDVSLLDKYKQNRTFHLIFQSGEKNLTAKDIQPIREKVLKYLKEKYQIMIKE